MKDASVCPLRLNGEGSCMDDKCGLWVSTSLKSSYEPGCAIRILAQAVLNIDEEGIATYAR